MSAGIKTREEARADLGLAPAGGKGQVAAGKRLEKFNPNHGRTTGWFTSADDPDAQPTETPRRELIAEDDGAKTPAGFKLNAKALRRMKSRGWTPEEIDEAVKSGNRIDAQNKATGNPATRYVNPTSGKSVVIDNVTNSVVQVGGDDFEHSVESGDLPGATMRPPPSATGSGGGGGGGSDPFRYNPGLIPDEEEPLY